MRLARNCRNTGRRGGASRKVRKRRNTRRRPSARSRNNKTRNLRKKSRRKGKRGGVEGFSLGRIEEDKASAPTREQRRSWRPSWWRRSTPSLPPKPPALVAAPVAASDAAPVAAALGPGSGGPQLPPRTRRVRLAPRDTVTRVG